jgi:hypothetical protein
LDWIEGEFSFGGQGGGVLWGLGKGFGYGVLDERALYAVLDERGFNGVLDGGLKRVRRGGCFQGEEGVFRL